MSDFYIKNVDGQFIPLTSDFFSLDNPNNLISITVGNDKEPATNELIEYVYKTIKTSSVFVGLMRSSSNDLLVLPHSIKVEVLSKHDIENKTIYVSVKDGESISNFPEFIGDALKTIGAKVLPAPITLKEYDEIKQVCQRIKLKKKRSGGGLNQP